MFEKEKIDLIYRIICLITFVIVILFVNSMITLALLILFFFLSIRKENDFVLVFLSVLTFLFFAISSLINNYGLFKLFIMLDYTYYFLSIPSLKDLLGNVVNKKEEKVDKEEITLHNEEEDDEIIRFQENRKVAKRTLNIASTVYLTFHLGVLFLAIMVG